MVITKHAETRLEERAHGSYSKEKIQWIWENGKRIEDLNNKNLMRYLRNVSHYHGQEREVRYYASTAFLFTPHGILVTLLPVSQAVIQNKKTKPQKFNKKKY